MNTKKKQRNVTKDDKTSGFWESHEWKKSSKMELKPRRSPIGQRGHVDATMLWKNKQREPETRPTTRQTPVTVYTSDYLWKHNSDVFNSRIWFRWQMLFQHLSKSAGIQRLRSPWGFTSLLKIGSSCSSFLGIAI